MGLRFAILTALWLVLDGGRLSGLVVGLPLAAVAAMVSCRMVPSGTFRPRFFPLLRLVGFCLWESVTAGWDVAVRALRPGLPLAVGEVRVACGIPAGPIRNVLCALGSLMPGSLPVSDDDGGHLVLHVLDTRRPSDEAAQRLEALVREAFRADA